MHLWSSLSSSLLLMVVVVVVTTPSANTSPGTTVHFQEIFMGRCYDYRQIRYKSVLPQISETCEDLYIKFFEAFSLRSPCAVVMDNYVPFMEAAKQQLPVDKAMFWSGVKELAHKYASGGERYVTLEDTLIGYLVDGLVWCGQRSLPGVNFTRCPSWSDCPLESSESFWAAASRSFAQSASGQVTVMMDASRSDRPAYRRNSFFGKYELPNLDTNVVTGVNVLLTHPLESFGFESCYNGSMVLLKEDVVSRDLTFTCVDDPQAILHLLCVEDPSDWACHLASQYVLDVPGTDREKSQPPVFNAKPNRF